jgi:transcription elongation factor Elf1
MLKKKAKDFHKKLYSHISCHACAHALSGQAIRCDWDWEFGTVMCKRCGAVNKVKMSKKTE